MSKQLETTKEVKEHLQRTKQKVDPEKSQESDPPKEGSLKDGSSQKGRGLLI